MATMAQSIRLALHVGETQLGVHDIFGQDVGPPLGGVFTVTQGLKTAWNTPLDERGLVGAAMGIALTGTRCVAEVQFCDYIFNTIDLLKIAGNTSWVSNGNYNLPMVVMTPVGSGIHGSIYHSHSFDAWATRLTGWKICMPSNPLDAYGMMLAAIQDPDPVLYLKPKALLRVKGEQRLPGEPEDEKQLKKQIDAPLGDRSQWSPEWPELEIYTVPVGKACVVREGCDITLVSYGRTLPLCVQVADDLNAQDGGARAAASSLSGSRPRVEVIDLRWLYPYDWQCVRASVQKTGRVLFVNEDTEVTNFGEHLAARATRELFYELKAAPRVLAGKNLPGIGLHPNLEQVSVPQRESIQAATTELLTEEA